ncbi:MAG: type I restriction-modification system subunit M [Candidatus Omnitrophica bacterium]|nr:type I restriction-modification system subunit M [Candidatus Omnitrophota bacterium]MBU4478407.1 type I restriction-modification system subunit M [Candidatus Omnitrophota bacterium]
MTAVISKSRLNNFANQIWKSAERMRGKFKAYEYQSVILPMIVIRRFECVLIDWRAKEAEKIKSKRPTIKDKELDSLVKNLELNPRNIPFSNKTSWTLRKICDEDPTLLEKNFRAYINGFSENIQDIINRFDFRATIGKMVTNARLEPIVSQYANEELGPDQFSNLEMGYIYEELLRRFSEQSGEEAGEHFTPREIIRLMVELLDIPLPKKHTSIYDPACGTGGMLSVAKEHLLDQCKTEKEQQDVENLVSLHGHERQPGNYAICQADMLIKNDKQAHIYYGNSLIPHKKIQNREDGDQLAEQQFDYMLSNPPFGVTWGGKDGYEKEAKEYAATRYKAGMPRTDDGALLFLQTMLAKMKSDDDGGSKIAVVFNGSPMSNGDCGSGPSEIRRWILENDWLDCIVMLPEQLFYNTGIFTFIWILTNKKIRSHKDKVMIIDARMQFDKEPKSFGDKRNRLLDEHRAWIEDRYKHGWKEGNNDECVKVFSTKDFAYHKISVTFWQTDGQDKPAVITELFDKPLTSANVKKKQEFYATDIQFDLKAVGRGKTEQLHFVLKPQDTFVERVEAVIRQAFDKKEADKSALKEFIKNLTIETHYTHPHYVVDDEYISDGENIEAFLKREMTKPIIRWQDSSQLGYEILPNKYFYRFQSPVSAKDLLAEFWRLEKEAENKLKGLAIK